MGQTQLGMNAFMLVKKDKGVSEYVVIEKKIDSRDDLP